MKIIKDGAVLRIKCDGEYCPETVEGEDVPNDWLEIEGCNWHYCPDCQWVCPMCGLTYSLKYKEDWSVDDLCENCQERYKRKDDKL